MKRGAERHVGRASSLPVLGASGPNPESRNDRALRRVWKPLEPAGGDACPTAPLALCFSGPALLQSADASCPRLSEEEQDPVHPGTVRLRSFSQRLGENGT